MRRLRRLAAVAIAATLALTACGSSGPGADPGRSGQAAKATHTVTDMAGRTVELPTTVTKVVTLGAVPVINSFLFALGEGDLIANGLPVFAANPRWKYQYVFAPQTEKLPSLQGADGSPSVEKIVALQPDVVLTMVEAQAQPLDAVGLKTVVLRWQDAEDVKKVVTLLGDVVGQPERAAGYQRVFDHTLATVADVVGDLPADQRVTALLLDPKAMTQPHIISQWWIDKAGGVPVTKDNKDQETLKLNVEQVVTWNPQVLFVGSPDDVRTVLADKRLAQVAAVRDRRVYSVPIAAHTWGNRTSEQPLTVLWAASKLCPDKFADGQVAQLTQAFYRDVYHVDLTDAQVNEILAGM